MKVKGNAVAVSPGRSKKRRDDGTTGHLAARGSASRYMACRKATRQATELTTV